MIRVLFLSLLSWSGVLQVGHSEPMTPSDRKDVLDAVIEHLETDYVEPDIGRSAAQNLRQSNLEGEFNQVVNGELFADLISKKLQSLTGDGHLNLEYSSEPIALDTPAEAEFAASELERYYGAHLNYGVEEISRLENNIGYLDLRVFAPIDMGGDTVIAAMNVLAHTDALIIDLRKNGGGIGDMADLVASFLFDTEPQPLTGTYDRPKNELTQRFTQAYVPGDRFGADKPVYVLISPRTFSAAEALAYNLQALDRATIVGEASGGGAHPFEYLPVHEHFVLWSVTAKSINPLTNGNWQGVGVVPDVLVSAEDALETALSQLANKMSRVSN